MRGGPAINLPVALQNGSYQFDITVQAGQTYYLDPTVAVGYVFQTGAGNPNFSSVVLPTGIGIRQPLFRSSCRTANKVSRILIWVNRSQMGPVL